VADLPSDDLSLEQRAAEREADAAGLYAPPREDALPPPLPGPSADTAMSPGLVGFLTLLCTSVVSSVVAGVLMAVWCEISPDGTGFLAGLGEAIFAMLSWMALSAFALLAGIALAVGLLGRKRQVGSSHVIIVAILGLLATVVCFLPEPKDTFVSRGFMSLLCEAFTVGMTYAALRAAGKRWLGPPPPPRGMALD
jgi:hypothetical protein